MIVKTLLLALCMSVASVPLLRAETVRLAVVDFQAGDVPPNLAIDITDILRTEIMKTGYFTVIERGEMKTLLKEQALQLTGLVETADAVKMGAFLSAQKILSGRVSKIGDLYVVNVRVIDVEKAQVEAAEKIESAKQEELVVLCTKLARKLAATMYGLPYEDESVNVLALKNVSLGKKFKVDLTPVREIDLPAPVNAIAVNADQTRLAVGLDDGRVRIYHARSFQLLATNRTAGRIKSITFDGKDFVLCGADRNISFLSPANNTLKTIPANHKNTVNRVAVSPDGKHLVTASDDWNLNVIENGNPYMTLSGHKTAANNIRFAPDGRLLISVDNNKKAIFWQPPYFTQLKEIAASKDRILALDVSPDSKRFVLSGYAKTIGLFDLQSSQLLGEFTGHTGTVSSLLFVTDGIFLSGSFDGVIKTWKVRDPTQASLPSSFFLLSSVNAHKSYITDMRYLDQTGSLITAGNDRKIKVWKLLIKEGE